MMEWEKIQKEELVTLIEMLKFSIKMEISSNIKINVLKIGKLILIFLISRI